jgi:hypothetical protein
MQAAIGPGAALSGKKIQAWARRDGEADAHSLECGFEVGPQIIIDRQFPERPSSFGFACFTLIF